MVEEEALLVWVSPAYAQVVLNRVGVEEVLWALNQPDMTIMEQGADPTFVL
jgi:hypothetical protein